MIVLRVGDPHVKQNNLKESDALMQFALDKAIELKVDVLEILGDLFDTHSIVRLEVLEFWHKWFTIFSQQRFKVIVLVGNHDLTGNYSSTYSALHPFSSLENQAFKIVKEPYLDGVFGYLPYIHSNEKFVEEANKLADKGATVLVSHPNYAGAVYDNGSPINGGVNDSDLSSRFVSLIGGHIHTQLEMGRVWYTGNPRWMTKSCANKQKGIWAVTHAHDGQILVKQFISTESVCTPIVSIVWKEGEDKPAIPPNCNTNVELIGSSDWVSKQKVDLKGLVSISSKITDTKKSRVRKSGKTLNEFLTQHYQTSPEMRQKLIKYLGDLKLV